MTEPTYFARIGNEAEREMAEFLSGQLGSAICYEDGEFVSGIPVGNTVELPFSGFIRRFVPLSVIWSLAECHGCSVITNGSMKIIDKALEEAGYIKVDEVNDDNT